MTTTTNTPEQVAAVPLATALATEAPGIGREHRRVITASALGTIFEWYDFYLYGSLASVIGKQFFSGVNETTSFIFALLAFSAGFAVRPLGAVIFGRLGDLVGRKHTFLITIVIMGISTALVGVLPTHASIGVAAPSLLIALRLLQGLAIGGEYGGAAIYVAEHAPAHRRGSYTSWIQTTATIGLILSLLVILSCRLLTGTSFEVWGWRIPFLLSTILLAISVYIRLQMEESPVFQAMRNEGRLSRAPVSEALGRWKNLRLVLLALFGATAGQGTVAYCSLVYMLLFLEQTLKVDPKASTLVVVAALLITTPLFVVFGKLSDRIGRKPLVMAGFAIAIVTLFPLFRGLTHYANPALDAAQRSAPVVVVADPEDCSFQFDPIGKVVFSSSCDVIKTALARAGVPYVNQSAPAGTLARVRIGEVALAARDVGGLETAAARAYSAEFGKSVRAELARAGYPTVADSSRIDYPMLLLLLVLLTSYGTLVYSSLAAWLVELFPPRIRYTSLSLPYHIGNGWFGGFVPTIAFALVAYTGNIYQGLWYPIGVATVSLIVGGLFLKETRGVAATD
ncbi:MAG TPA: MFS transporter [Polyangiales bacterium]|nr:MFS transporter [Polyangiales bacterium]